MGPGLATLPAADIASPDTQNPEQVVHASSSASGTKVCDLQQGHECILKVTLFRLRRRSDCIHQRQKTSSRVSQVRPQALGCLLVAVQCSLEHLRFYMPVTDSTTLHVQQQ